MKERNPDLWQRMLAKVESGQFIPVGGTWVEPDCNVPSGESLVRQFLYGQRFFERELGVPLGEPDPPRRGVHAAVSLRQQVRRVDDQRPCLLRSLAAVDGSGRQGAGGGAEGDRGTGLVRPRSGPGLSVG